MLNAILHGKKRGTGFVGIKNELGEVEGAEDVLTATCFERLSYLPDHVVAEVFVNLAADDSVNSAQFDAAGLDKIQYWPRWHLSNEGREREAVEPDVVLYLGATCVIVEAKRFDSGRMQEAAQLARELRASVKCADLAGIDRIVLLTIGGLNDYSREARASLKKEIDDELNGALDWPRGYALITRSWKQLFKAIEDAVRAVNGRDATRYGSGLDRLLDDLRNALRWHKIATSPQYWFSDFAGVGISSSEFVAPFGNDWSNAKFFSTLVPIGLNGNVELLKGWAEIGKS